MAQIKFLSANRVAKLPPNEDFPYGVVIDLSVGASKSCTVNIPYPAPCCGVMQIDCDKCGNRIVVTVAGRADDPHTVKMACHMRML
jgi:hypothetical protein